MENYCPISILPRFSEIIERVVCLQLGHYFETHSMLSTARFGFRKNLSTELAYQDAVKYIHSNIEMENYTQEIFIDLAKAFDSLDRSLLLKKLANYGIRSLSLR